MIGKLVELFYPNRCRACERILSCTENFLCVSCASTLPFAHFQDTQANPLIDQLQTITSAVHEASFLLWFEKGNTTQKVMHALKYQNQPQIGVLLAKYLSPSLPFSSYDLVVPVPVHPQKQRRRGYNQVDGFAREFAAFFGLDYLPNALERTRQKASQVSRNQAQRLKQLGASFSLAQPEAIEGKRVVLIDDVCTTGATLKTCIDSMQEKTSSIAVYTIALVKKG